MSHIFIMLLFGASNFHDFPDSYKPSKEFALIYSLQEQYIQEIVKNKKYECTRCGGGGTEKNKHNHSFSFAFFEEKNIEEAREMLLGLVEKAVIIFNNSEEYKQYLKEGPYTYQNFDICLFFRKSDGSFGETEQFSGCCIRDGVIEYKNRTLGDSRVLCKETYEEAKAKLAVKP